MGSLHHHCPSLSADLIGAEDTKAGLALFRGIPFATVSKRWTQSQVKDSLSSPFDATKFGPRCPQPPHVSVITASQKVPDFEEDEFSCLNLNIACPVEALPKKNEGESGEKKLLPVFVWVHGGAFKNGSISDPRFYSSALSTLASRSSHPVIIVQIAYRLGVFGFLASNDLLSEHTSAAASASELEPFANFGLHDQKTAFQWIQTHISDFGGDPENVTACGVSAGSASLHMHILSGKPLFDRAILMSGCAPTMGPFPLPLFEKGWMKFCKSSGVDGLESAEERLEGLRSLSTEEAMKKMGGSSMFAPLAEGAYLPLGWKVGDKHPRTRCKEIIVSNTLVEAIIFDILAALLPQQVFYSKVLAAFPDTTDSSRFIELFGFSFAQGKEMSPDEYRDALRSFLSTVVFHYPSLRVAESFSSTYASPTKEGTEKNTETDTNTKSYLYHINTPSPYPGPSYNLSVHGLCAILLFNNADDAWTSDTRYIAENLAKTLIRFAYGEEPCQEFAAGGPVMTFEEKGLSLGPLEQGEDVGWGREDGTIGWLREHFEEAARLVMGLMG
ncbi:hypothetical protein VTL71DRAFT_15398 [Oculimacula yallundae]|uniref:Carboxylesterase type B domain-containing protein n=1 Tax=Oculimacula yallundae TaxID=86028 RepID=A0ABR4CGI5_9HELO